MTFLRWKENALSSQSYQKTDDQGCVIARPVQLFDGSCQCGDAELK